MAPAARELMGVPFLHQGRDPAVGVDCVGLAGYAMDRNGVSYVDLKGYGRSPHAGRLMATIDNQPHLRRTGAPVAGGIVLFRIKRDPQHVAVFDGEELIHAYLTAGKVTSNPLDDWWRSRIVACYEVVL